MTVPRKSRLPALLFLALAICAPRLDAQEAAEAAAEKQQTAEVLAAAEKPAAKRSRQARVRDEDDEKPARSRRSARAAATPVPVSTAAATATPPKRGFLSRILGRKPAATPAPVVTPASPSPKPRKARRDDDDDKPRKARKDDEDDKPKRDGPRKAAASDTDKPTDSDESTEEPVKPKIGKTSAKHPASAKQGAEVGATQRSLDEAIASGDPAEIDKARYSSARAKAMTDPEVSELKSKADSASSEEEGRKDLREYNRALYDKMRKLEPSISARVDRMEAAVLKRLEN